MSAPQKSDPFEVFMSALVGADRVVIQTRNALGENDSHYLPAPELLDAWNTRADLCTPTDERLQALEAENARLREAAYLLYEAQTAFLAAEISYHATPVDRGGASGPKGKAKKAAVRAREAMMQAGENFRAALRDMEGGDFATAGEAKADLCAPTDERARALEVENARLREALEYIQKPQYGLQGITEDGDSDEERANYFSAWCGRYQDRARAALRDTE